MRTPVEKKFLSPRKRPSRSRQPAGQSPDATATIRASPHASLSSTCKKCGNTFSLNESHSNRQYCATCLDVLTLSARNRYVANTAVLLTLFFGPLGMLYVNRFLLSALFGWPVIVGLIVVSSELGLPEETTWQIAGFYVLIYRIFLVLWTEKRVRFLNKQFVGKPGTRSTKLPAFQGGDQTMTSGLDSNETGVNTLAQQVPPLQRAEVRKSSTSNKWREALKAVSWKQFATILVFGFITLFFLGNAFQTEFRRVYGSGRARGSYSGYSYVNFVPGYLLLGFLSAATGVGLFYLAAYKRCPRCGERIRQEALICRFCSFEIKK